MSKFLDLRIDGAGDSIWSLNDVEVARMDSSFNFTTRGTVNGVAHVSPFAVFFTNGVLSVAPGAGFFPAAAAQSVAGIVLCAGTAPVGADIIVDINVNGVSIFTTQANRPRILAGSNISTVAVPDVTMLANGDLISRDIDQVGSSTAGSDLTVVVLAG